MQYASRPVQVSTVEKMLIQNWPLKMLNAFTRQPGVSEHGKEIAIKIGWWAIVVNRRLRRGKLPIESSIAYHWFDGFFYFPLSTCTPNSLRIHGTDRFRMAIMASVQSSTMPHSSTTIRQWRRPKHVARQMTLAMQPIGLVMAPSAWDIFKWLMGKEKVSTKRISIVTQLETRHTHRSSIPLINFRFMFSPVLPCGLISVAIKSSKRETSIWPSVSFSTQWKYQISEHTVESIPNFCCVYIQPPSVSNGVDFFPAHIAKSRPDFFNSCHKSRRTLPQNHLSSSFLFFL